MILGIDPGWKSFGLAVVNEGKLVHTETLDPSSYGATPFYFIEAELIPIMTEYNICFSVMERFVSYEGTLTSKSEEILMCIGAVQLCLESGEVPVKMVRAFDWKRDLCKLLVKTKNFSNPYGSFDKKYSVHVAKFLAGEGKFSTHEADAICMAFYGEHIFNES